MDELVAGAVVAVWHADEREAERWFGTVQAAVGDDDGALDWDTTRERLVEQAQQAGVPEDTVTTFLTYLDSYATEPLYVVREMSVMMSSGSLLPAYADLAAAAAAEAASQWGSPEAETIAGPSGDTVPFDQAAWAEYLGQWNGQWDGDAATWPAFAERFTYYAPDGLREAVAALLVDFAGREDKVEALAAYGIAVTPAYAEPEAAAEPEAYAEPAAAEPEPAEPAEAGEVTDEAAAAEVEAALQQEVLPAVAEALEAIPQAAELTEDEIREVLLELLAEELDQTSAAG